MFLPIADIQRALRQRGYDPGPADGVWGRRSIAAAKAFQAARALDVDGVVGPQTLAALFPRAARPLAAPPPWHAEIKRRMDLHEVRDKAVLWAWLRSGGGSVGDPSKVPWCGDLVETAIARTLPGEPLPNNPYLARNWLKFGVALDEPAIGAVMVFWRGARHGISGHVGLYDGEDASAFSIVGGNQSNAITRARLGKDRLLGIRWPATFPLPTTGRVLRAGRGALSRNEA